MRCKFPGLYSDFISSFESDDSGAFSDDKEGSGLVDGQKRKTNTQYIREFLKSKPLGASAKQIVAALEAKIQTESPHPDRIIRSTLVNLVNAEKITKGEFGEYTLN